MNQPPSPSRQGLNLEKPNGLTVVFVHGLGGSPESTWTDMIECFRNDDILKGATLDFYSFPTSLFRLPFAAPLPGLRSIAEGLTTFLDERHPGLTDICLVTHSLGGVIARQMIVAEQRSGRKLRIGKLVLIAVPNNGSMLANVAGQISFKHRQLKSLTRDDEALRGLNADWEQLKIEEKISVRYVVGGCDRTVPHESAVPHLGRENRKSLLIDANHRSIIQPQNQSDIRYTVIKRFLIEAGEVDTPKASQEILPQVKPQKAPDPLFDVYAQSDSQFYINRNIDRIVGDTLCVGHIWLSGPSGVGKTTVLRRTAYENGWQLNHLNLGGYRIDNEVDLFRAIAIELSSLIDPTNSVDANCGFRDCCRHIKSILAKLPIDTVYANVIEELPIDTDQLDRMVDQIAIFIETIFNDPSLHGRSVFAFSSLQSPVNVSPKTRDKIQMLQMNTWSIDEISRLVILLASTLKPELSIAEQNSIVLDAQGSPRFVKQLFRKWRNGTTGGLDLTSLLKQVRLEQI